MILTGFISTNINESLVNSVVKLSTRSWCHRVKHLPTINMHKKTHLTTNGPKFQQEKMKPIPWDFSNSSGVSSPLKK